jgi:uncharacterized SAM-binding protein YcdF (DUF218 family)
MTLGPEWTAPSIWSRVGWLARILIGVLLFWLGGFLHFVDDVTALTPPPPDRATDGIVVLTGGAERIEAGLKLLAAGKAKRLLVTGVHKGTSAEMLPLREKYPPALFACCVTLGTAAADTVGNAAEAGAWARKEGFKSLRLVTAAYHLPRSAVEFRRFMPDIELVPHAVFTDNVRLTEWYLHPGTARLLAGEFDKYVVSLVRARLVGER